MSMVDVDEIVTSLLAAGLDDASIGAVVPANLADKVPFVAARQIPGGSSRYPQFGQTAGVVQVDSFAASRKDARSLSLQCVDVLNTAWENSTSTDAGAIAAFGPVSGPWQMSSEFVPAGICHFIWTAFITCCP